MSASLIENLRLAKANLSAAKEQVFQAEAAIYRHYENQLPQEGTFKDGDLKIQTSFYYKWGQEALLTAKANYPSSEPWPFELQYLPDNKQIKYLKEYRKELYDILQSALTITPKKPAFLLKGEKEND